MFLMNKFLKILLTIIFYVFIIVGVRFLFFSVGINEIYWPYSLIPPVIALALSVWFYHDLGKHKKDEPRDSSS
jgi:mannitol-specific phosphotransferase system IIBC component